MTLVAEIRESTVHELARTHDVHTHIVSILLYVVSEYICIDEEGNIAPRLLPSS